MPSLFHDRDFALLFGGETISELGSAVNGLAFPLVAVAVLHANPFQIGLVAAAANAAWLFVALPAGAWVDRIRRRPILIGTDLIRALLVATVPVAWAMHVLTVAQLVIVAFLISMATVVFDVAYPAFLPSIVTADRLVEGNGALEASTNSANVIGPSIGGLLVQLWGAPVTLLVDAASFLVSASTIGAMRVDERRPQRPEGYRPRLWAEIGAGLRYVVRHRLIAVLTVGVAMANLVFGAYGAVILVFLARQIGLAPGVIGVLFAVGAVGGVIGAMISGPVARRIGDARLLWISTVVTTPALLMIPFTSKGAGLLWFIIGSLVINIGIAAFNVSARAAIQRSAPAALLGRVTASIRVFSRGALPVGALIGGTLAGVFNPRVALAVDLGLYALVPIWLWCSPLGRVRDVADLDVESDEVALTTA